MRLRLGNFSETDLRGFEGSAHPSAQLPEIMVGVGIRSINYFVDPAFHPSGVGEMGTVHSQGECGC